MPYEISQVIPQKLISLQYRGNIDIPTFQESIRALNEWTATYPDENIYWILDLTELEHFGVPLSKIHAMDNNYRHLKWLLIVKPHNTVAASFAYTIVNILILMWGWNKLRWMNRMEDVFSFLAAEDSVFAELMGGTILLK